jgi:hypothetical protein
MQVWKMPRLEGSREPGHGGNYEAGRGNGAHARGSRGTSVNTECAAYAAEKAERVGRLGPSL